MDFDETTLQKRRFPLRKIRIGLEFFILYYPHRRTKNTYTLYLSGDHRFKLEQKRGTESSPCAGSILFRSGLIATHALRACSYDPTCRDVSPSGTDITVCSYGVFHPACRDEILLLALAKHDISVTRHKYLTILAFFFIYLQQKALLEQDI